MPVDVTECVRMRERGSHIPRVSTRNAFTRRATPICGMGNATLRDTRESREVNILRELRCEIFISTFNLILNIKFASKTVMRDLIVVFDNQRNVYKRVSRKVSRSRCENMERYAMMKPFLTNAYTGRIGRGSGNDGRLREHSEGGVYRRRGNIYDQL